VGHNTQFVGYRAAGNYKTVTTLCYGVEQRECRECREYRGREHRGTYSTCRGLYPIPHSLNSHVWRCGLYFIHTIRVCVCVFVCVCVCVCVCVRALAGPTARKDSCSKARARKDNHSVWVKGERGVFGLSPTFYGLKGREFRKEPSYTYIHIHICMYTCAPMMESDCTHTCRQLCTHTRWEGGQRGQRLLKRESEALGKCVDQIRPCLQTMRMVRD
jgi:hypothetical protein